jgi:hypothetical protein
MRQVLLLTLLLTSSLSNGQTRTITGKVIGEDLGSIDDVQIHIQGTVRLGATDKEGNFKIDLPTGTDILLFIYLGMELTSVKVPQDCNNLEIIMMMQGYSEESSRKVDEKRKKSFDYLPQLYSKAVASEIFSRETQCFIRDFEPYKPRLDEISREMKVKRKQNREIFKKIEIGDTLSIPFSGGYGSDGTDRTTLSVYSFVVDDKQFDCIIKGVLLDKDTRKGGYNLTYKVTDCQLCNYKSPIYQDKEMTVGAVFRYDMKYLKVLTK